MAFYALARRVEKTIGRKAAPGQAIVAAIEVRKGRGKRLGFEAFWRETGVAPGQACVLYDRPGGGARVLGGGFIDRAERTRAAEQALRELADSPVEAVA